MLHGVSFAILLVVAVFYVPPVTNMEHRRTQYLQWRGDTARTLNQVVEHDDLASLRRLASISVKSYTKQAKCLTDAYPKPPAIKLIGHICAFAPELTEIVKLLTGKVIVARAGRKFILGVVDGQPIVTTISGIGPMNMALTAQLMIDLFPVSVIVQTGIAGGVDPSKRVGDVVIPRKWANYQIGKFIRTNVDGGYEDFNVDFPSTFYRDGSGEVPSFLRAVCPKVDGVVVADGKVKSSANPPLRTSGLFVPMLHETFVNPDDAFATPLPPQQFWFKVPDALITAAKNALKKGIKLERTGFDPIAKKNFTFPYQPQASVSSAGVSGPTFVDNAEVRQAVFQEYNAQVVDMESASFMMVCKSNKIPGIVVRSVSDLAGGNQGANVILSFIDFAARNSIRVLLALMKEL